VRTHPLRVTAIWMQPACHAVALRVEFLLKTDGGYPNCTSQFYPRRFPSRTLARIIFLPLSFCWDTPSLQTPPNLGSQDVPPRSTPPCDWILPCWKYKAAPLKVRLIVGTITGAIKANHFFSYREVGQRKFPVFGELEGIVKNLCHKT